MLGMDPVAWVNMLSMWQDAQGWQHWQLADVECIQAEAALEVMYRSWQQVRVQVHWYMSLCNAGPMASCCMHAWWVVIMMSMLQDMLVKCKYDK